MIKPSNLLYIFAVIAALLVAIAVLNVVTQNIFGKQQKPEIKEVNLVYDPLYQQNVSLICPLETNCTNTTLWYVFVPWLGYDVWRNYFESKVVVVEEEKEEIEETPEVIVEEDVVETAENATSRKEQSGQSQMVYIMLAGILALSSSLACLEVARERLKARGEAHDVGKPGKRCSLADFRINKHLRRESQQMHAQQFEQTTAKVTQQLVHQGSLDRAISKISSEVKPPLIRRSSVPAHLVSGLGSNQQVEKLIKQQSCDLSGDELTPEMRRKSRHFIRRH